MKKRLTLLVLTLVLSSSLFATTHDVSFTFGHQMWLENPNGIDLYAGLSVGLSKRVEAGIWYEGMLTPHIFGDNALGLSCTVSLLGDRTNSSYTTASSFNMLVSAGVIFTDHNQYDLFIPTDIYISFTPLVIGSPVYGTREKLCEVGVSYNWFTRKFRFLFSLFKLDWFLYGRVSDYKELP